MHVDETPIKTTERRSGDDELFGTSWSRNKPEITTKSQEKPVSEIVEGTDADIAENPEEE
jgi:hypothetical protein